MNNETAITVYDGIQGDPIGAIKEIGEMIFRSGMFGCSKPEQGQILALECAARKQAPLTIKKSHYIVEGNLTMRADAMLAEFRVRGGKCKWKQWDSQAAVADFTWEGDTYAMSFTIKDATERNLLKSHDGKLKYNWINSRPHMLRARLITDTLRMIAPEIVAGMYTPDEVSDFAQAAPVEEMQAKVTVVEHTPKDTLQLVKDRDNVFDIIDAKPELHKAEAAAGSVKPILIEKLEALLQELEPFATDFFIEKKYIQYGQTYRDVDPVKADRMLGNPTPLLTGINRRKQSAVLTEAAAAKSEERELVRVKSCAEKVEQLAAEKSEKSARVAAARAEQGQIDKDLGIEPSDIPF